MSHATLLLIRSGSAALQRETQRIARPEELCSLRVFCVGRPRGKILNVPPVARPRGLRGRTSVGRTHPWVGSAADRERRCGAAWPWSWRYIRAISKLANTKGHTLYRKLRVQ